jgi:hypothetical protein
MCLVMEVATEEALWGKVRDCDVTGSRLVVGHATIGKLDSESAVSNNET